MGFGKPSLFLNRAKTTSNLCPLCGNSPCSFVKLYRGKTNLFSGKKILECKACEIAFVDRMPSNHDLENYNKAYFKSAHDAKSSKDLQNSFFRGMAKLRLSYMLDQINKFHKSNIAVLEVGPGNGFLAENILAKWPETEYFGIETDLSCHPFLHEKKVKILDPLGHFPNVDVLILSHVLEHVAQPVPFMIRLVESLKSGGLLFVEVPCQDHLHKRIHEPHLLFFNKKSLKIMLKKIGLREIQLSYHGQTLKNLVNRGSLDFLWRSFKLRILGFCFIKKIALEEPELQGLTLSEQAAVEPWRAHVESQEPAWWLRALAVKP